MYASIIRPGVRRGPPGTLTAQRTTLGWILLGAIETSQCAGESFATTLYGSASESLDEALKRFWEIEEIPKMLQSSPDDLECERLFKEGQRRDDTGRYIVRLPLRIHGPLPLKGSLSAAKRSLERTHAMMSFDPTLAKEYFEFMRDYEDLHHMRRIREDRSAFHGGRVAYLPHHGIWQHADQSKKLHVVFNASHHVGAAPSLNDILYTGPALQSDLVSIILRWRIPRVAISMDIQKMYRQIRVDLRHVDLPAYCGNDRRGTRRHTISYVDLWIILRHICNSISFLNKDLASISALCSPSFPARSNVTPAPCANKTLVLRAGLWLSSWVCAKQFFDLRILRSQETNIIFFLIILSYDNVLSGDNSR